MSQSKKLLAVLLSCLVLLDSPVISLTAAAPDTTSSESTIFQEPSPAGSSDNSKDSGYDMQINENETTDFPLSFYYLKTIPDTFSQEDALFHDPDFFSEEIPASVTAGETFYLALLSPDGQTPATLGLNPQELFLTADNAAITYVSHKDYTGFLAAVTPKKEGLLHLEAFLTSDQEQGNSPLAQADFTVTPEVTPGSREDSDSENGKNEDLNDLPGGNSNSPSDTDTLPSEGIVSENFQLNYSQYTMNTGETFRLYPAISPVLADNVTWTSSHPDIASVDDDGNVTAIKKGTAVIKASIAVTEQGLTTLYEAFCSITVNNTMAFSKTAYTLHAGKTQQLNLYTSEAGAAVDYKSSNTSVATVSSTGLVTAVNGGNNGAATAVITASWDGLTASCSVTVKNTISLNKKSYTVYTGTKQNYTLKATAAPKGTVTWKSSNSKIAAISPTGKITPKKAGKVTITAAAGGVSASCIITVKKPSLSLASKKTVYLKNPVTLTAKSAPSGKVTWKSSNKKVATVNSKGTITPKKTGTAYITATCNGITKKCKITVKKPSVKASMATLYLFEGNESMLSASARPNVAVKWKSSNKKIVTIDKNGRVIGVKAGTTSISASVPGANAKVKVIVLKNTYKLNLTKQTLMTGTSTYLYMNSIGNSTQVYFEPGDYSSDAVSLSVSGNKCKITAKNPGKTTVSAYFYTVIDGQTIGCRRSCTITVIDKGIRQQQFSLALKAKKQLSLKHAAQTGTSIQKIRWSSSNPKAVSVNASTGLVTAKRTGTAKISAKVNYANGTSKTFSTSIKVSNPKLNSSYTVLAVGSSSRLKLKGTNSYSRISWKSRKSSLVSVAPDGSITASYGKTGKTTITAAVDGKTIKHQVYVTDPTLNTYYKVLAPRQTAKITIKKASSKSKISYKSSNTGIASVSKKGIVTAKGYGNCNITIKADGKILTFQVNVAPQAAVNACNTGYSIMYSSTYSQPLRMTSGFYDCSSLVFRAYGHNTGLLGGSVSWAPTAASMAAYLESTGKVISYGPLDVSQLRPGDLIFYSGDYNGRYRNINHVSMYYGGGYRLEKPLRYYYPSSNTVMVARPVS